MKTIVLLLSIVLLAVTVRGAIVYDNLGAGGTYDQQTGYGILQGTSNFAGMAAQFSAGTSGFLDTIDLGLTFFHAMPVNVYLDRNNGPVPSNNPTFLGSGTPTAVFGTSNDSLVSLKVVGNVPVTIGTTYWLVLESTVANPGNDFWNLSSPAATGLVSFSFNSGGFSLGVSQTSPAFRITARPVPEPDGSILLLLGLLAALFVSKKTFSREGRV